MKTKLLLCLTSLLAHSAFAAAPQELRCGWIENPTPANYFLVDAAGSWTISVQGGFQAEGDLAYPAASEYVKTNGNYGYFCGCVRATTNKTSMRVLKIFSAKALPLSVCLRDRKIDQDFRPHRQIHSNGKAYTECQDLETEQQIEFRRHSACVNKAGEYYYLAN